MGGRANGRGLWAVVSLDLTLLFFCKYKQPLSFKVKVGHIFVNTHANTKIHSNLFDHSRQSPRMVAHAIELPNASLGRGGVHKPLSSQLGSSRARAAQPYTLVNAPVSSPTSKWLKISRLAPVSISKHPTCPKLFCKYGLFNVWVAVFFADRFSWEFLDLVRIMLSPA